LLRNADVAMFRAKWEGKNRAVVFEPAMQWAARSRLELDMELQSAHENDEYFLVYQPTFDLETLRVTGAEALLRWHRPSCGDVLPGEFVPQLERSGLITAVGKWVLETACRQGAQWCEEGHEVPLSVNVSARQLDDPDFVDHVRTALESSGYRPGALTIEITETAIIQDTELSARQLASVRALGVRIAVDDFGTGFSSLTHLQYFPVDSLKIDRSFVASMLRGREAEALVHSLVQLGGALGIETLAEGIEDLAQLAHLRDEHCSSGQGFLFAEPLAPDEIGSFFLNWANGVDKLGVL
jgi:EAL domain-containing protein (putative c-di-GMP-specific phosphodiesterase class I)